MIWQDIVIERRVSESELSSALADAFNINTVNIVINKSVGDVVKSVDKAILCDIHNHDFGYCITVAIYLFIIFDRNADTILLQKISNILQTSILISDESPSYYSMTKVDPLGKISQVNIDPDRLDNFDEYHVI